MAIHITRRDLDKALSVAHAAYRRDPDVISKATGRLRASLEINGAAFFTGLAQGRFGPMLLPGGIPAAAVAGLAMHFAGFFGLANHYDEDLHNLADGVLAGYAHTLGMGFGGKLRTSAGLPAIWGTSLAGALGAGAGPVSEAELRAMARSVR